MRLAKAVCSGVLALVLLGAALPKPSWARHEEALQQEKLAEDYRIGSGDVLTITVLGSPEFSLNAQVLPDGTFVYPILGKIRAAGRTREEIASEIARGLKEKKQLTRPNVTLNVIQQERREITVLGAVRGAGKLELREKWTILDALGAAGGIGTGATATDRFEFYKAELFRDAQVITLDLAKIYANDPTQNLLLKNGDKIYVTTLDRNRISVTVIGEVGAAGRGGAVELPKDRSIITLLNDMGGVTERAALSKATILRQGQLTSIDLRGYKKGKLEKEILLEGGDVLTIPKIDSHYKVNGLVTIKGGELDYPDDRTLTLFEALTLSGIPSNGGNLKEVKLTRLENGVSTTQKVDVEKMLKGDRSQDMAIQPGDEIYIPASDPNKRRWGTLQDWLSLAGVLPGLYFLFRR
jgi:polysaccharide biosynthesis/export protein